MVSKASGFMSIMAVVFPAGEDNNTLFVCLVKAIILP